MQKELIILLGPVCSGKTTWSMNYLKHNPDSFRFCYDEFIYMCKGNGISSKEIADTAVVTIFNLIIKDKGDVVVDGFPLDFQQIKDLLEFSKKSTIRLFDVRFNDSIVRSVNRKERNGRFVNVDEMRDYFQVYKEFIHSKEFESLCVLATDVIADEFSDVNLSLIM